MRTGRLQDFPIVTGVLSLPCVLYLRCGIYLGEEKKDNDASMGCHGEHGECYVCVVGVGHNFGNRRLLLHRSTFL